MSEEFQYQRIFQILKNKIEPGSFPKDGITAFRALSSARNMLYLQNYNGVCVCHVVRRGLIKTSEGKRAIVH